MKPLNKLLFTGCIAITLFDVLGSIISKQFNFNYTYLFFVSFSIYTIWGFRGTCIINLKNGVLIAAFTGFFDSTIGWKISMLLHANTGNIKNSPTTQAWLVTIIFVTALAALCGLVGGAIANAIKKKPINSQADLPPKK
jgi:hypothetical protein